MRDTNSIHSCKTGMLDPRRVVGGNPCQSRVNLVQDRENPVGLGMGNPAGREHS